MNEIKLLFLCSKTFEQGKATRGAFLLTDIETKPIEFRCTSPVRPTELQATLYGGIMEQHIKVDLIGLPLIGAVHEQPSIILCEETIFLNIRAKIDVPMLFITSEEKLSLIKNVEDLFEKMDFQIERYKSFVFLVQKQFANDKESIETIFSKIPYSVDFNEAFQRVLTSLEQVHSEKILDK
jgi:hypothetical protein